MNLILMGYRGCGKTTVGRRLAGRMGWQFVDTDAVVEERAGQSLRQIFADEGEGGFRDREAAVIKEFSRKSRQILSIGGGAVLRQANVASLKRSGKLVWLRAPADVLWQQIGQDESRQRTRPHPKAPIGPEEFRRMVAVRDPIYAALADYTIDVAGRAVEQVAEAIETWARRRRIR